MGMKRPKNGWPWEKPGYTFSIGWPTGYVPVAADQALRASKKGQNVTMNSEKFSALRAARIARGDTRANGTIAGLSNKSDALRKRAA
jgi:hypothetical protein